MTLLSNEEAAQEKHAPVLKLERIEREVERK
jgi:hypothetical protein